MHAGSATCDCDASSLSQSVGAHACSKPLHVGHLSPPTERLPQAMCEYFSQAYNDMLDDVLPSEVVALSYISAFQTLAAPFLDAHSAWALNRTYFDTMLLDSRYPASPSRERGVWRVCSKCQRDGSFADAVAGKTGFAEDWRFRAAHAFRFIGFALDSAGAPCAALWDAADPDKLHYGPYNPRPCAQLPEAAPYRVATAAT